MSTSQETTKEAAQENPAESAPPNLNRKQDLFSLLVSSVRDYAIFLLDPEGNVASWNAGAERIKGYKANEIIGKHFSVFYPRATLDAGLPEHELKTATATGRYEDEGWRVRKDGSTFWANVVITALRDPDGELRGFAKVTRDLTERMRVEQSLRESEERYRLQVESVRDYSILMLDPAGRILTWNSGAERLKGYTAQEAIGKHFSIFYPEEARQKGWPEHELVLAREQGRFEDEGWRVRKDGSRFWANVVVTALANAKGEIRGFSKVTRDMSERKHWEDQIQALNTSLNAQVKQLAEANRIIEDRTAALRNLSARLLQIQDNERRHIARELHENIGQDLGAMKIILESELHKGTFDPKASLTIEEGLQLAHRVLTGIRNLSYLLHPPLLDEAGLAYAVQWYVDAFARHSGVQTKLTLIPPQFPRLDPPTETAIFRIVQESLSNVQRHAKASNAEVTIEKDGDRVWVRIRDYGLGISRESTYAGSARRGAGIGGMHERALQHGGDLNVTSAEPGTILEAWLPIPAQPAS